MNNSQRNESIRYLLSREQYDFYDLVLVTSLLRGEGGCPWDMEQTHKSIRNDLIEETYEVVEAIDNEDPALLREELGDLLLQVVFHAQIEREEGRFDISGVTTDICKKLIHRHPHVFGEVKVDGSSEVLVNWEKIKGEEKQRVTYTDKLRAIPPMYPALMRAQKVGKKVSFFDFADAETVMSKIYEETEEVREAIANGNAENVEEEIGDLLLTVTSLARHAGVKSEEALYKATNKFIDRFEKVEKYVLSKGGDIERMSMEELDLVWDEIKKEKNL